MKKRINITIDWWNDDHELIVPKKNEDTLTIEALTHITNLIHQGFTSGNLTASLYDSTYSGWWRINIETKANE